MTDGKPSLGLATADGAGGAAPRDRNVKLSPTIREDRHAEAIESIPLDAIQQFLSRPRVVGDDTLAKSAYIVGSRDEHLTFGSGNRIYVRALDGSTGGKYSIFRQGDPYVDPETEEVLGYEAEHLGDALIERNGDPATFFIINANKEILKGDRLMPQEEDEIPEFIPHAPASDVEGKIISVLNGVSQISQHQVVVLNRGDADGLEPGHVLAIYKDGDVINDVIGSDIEYRRKLDEQERAEHENPTAGGRMVAGVANDLRALDRAMRDFIGTPIEGGSSVVVQLPEERAGELMIFRTFDRVSFGLVMNTQRPVHLLDKVRNP